MKFLCLHGAGTSASILESQTTSFRAQLPTGHSHTFTFISGPITTAPAPGISPRYAGPYHRFFPSPPQPAAVHAAHAWLKEYIATHGPFDAMLGFSQGSSVIASWLLYAGAEEVGIRAAVFICGGVPMSVLADLGVEVSEVARGWDERGRVEVRERAGTVGGGGGEKVVERWGVGSWRAEDDVEEGNVFGIDFGKVPKEVRIGIPTVHVYGGKDPRYPASRQLVAMCKEENRRVFDTGGGHNIPRREEVSRGIAELVEWLADEVEREGK